jgi:hypothetical protein
MNNEMTIVGGTSFAGQTTVHPLGLAAVAVLGLCILFLPRRWAVFPFLVMACFVSSAQRIVVAGLDFDFLRIMVLFGVMRLVFRKEHINFIWKPLDTVIVFWAISSMFFFVVQQGTFGAVVNRLGIAFDAFGMYFVFRCLIKDWQDLDRMVFGVIIISIPVAVFFMLENRTGRNIFSIFGGVAPITSVREGRLRCQGAYTHAILAGCFWASLMPLIAAYWWKSKKDRIWAVVGIVASMIIIFCCASSTPVMGTIAAIIGGMMFFWRKYMRSIRWGFLLMLVALHMVMNHPVWHLICRVSAVGGSTGWHRFVLIDGAIRNFGDWWFSGCSADTVASWGVWAGDVTNQYLVEGIRGGFVTMCLFVVVISVAFRGVGRRWRLHVQHRYCLALSWAIGVSLFVHCINFIGVAYFGQIHIIWYMLLAIIASLDPKHIYSDSVKSTYVITKKEATVSDNE